MCARVRLMGGSVLMLLVYTAPPIEGQPQRAVVSIGREVQLDDCNWNNTECDVCCRRFLIKPFTIAVLFFFFVLLWFRWS